MLLAGPIKLRCIIVLLRNKFYDVIFLMTSYTKCYFHVSVQECNILVPWPHEVSKGRIEDKIDSANVAGK